jgi:hypothetical protein
MASRCATPWLRRRIREEISPEWGGAREELGVDERDVGEKEKWPATRSSAALGCGGGDGDRIDDGGGLAQRLVRPCARSQVGPVWPKREESRRAAH